MSTPSSPRRTLPPRPGPTQQAAPSPSTITPLQQVQFTVDDFTRPERIQFVNSTLSTWQTLINQLIGATGPTVLPAGIDVAGATVRGVGAPQQPTDAVNQAHVQSNYGPGALAPDLDIGGSHALKGLNEAYAISSQNSGSIATIQAALAAGFSGTIALAKLTGGGTNGSITVVSGLITAVVAPT